MMKKEVNKNKKETKRKTHNLKQKSENYEKQTKTAIIIMIVLIVSVILTHWIIQESNKFKYHGLEFYKEKEGDIIFYKTVLGYLSPSGGGNIPFILKLRNDPRRLSKIPLYGSINLRKEAILAISPELGNCSDTYITLIDFSRTLKAFGINAVAATTDKEYAKENTVSFASCEDAKEKSVIVLRPGNETKIIQDKSLYEQIIITGKEEKAVVDKTLSCYIIEISNCEVQQGFERFILSFIENSMMKV